MMQVRVLLFGVLKESFGASATDIELPDCAQVADLIEHLAASRTLPLLKGLAVSVNAEFASSRTVLHDGDEVGLLPPVSGGAPSSADAEKNDAEQSGSVTLTRSPIPSAEIIANAKRGEDGAVVVFDGIVRNETRGRSVLHLDYEAYEEMALQQMERLASEAKGKFGVRHVTMVHRLGRLQVGESSILIVVASAHRAQVFDASRWLIDTVKTTVPIWKKETFADGAAWADGEPFPSEVSISPKHAVK
jgi:molybdopterin synthase catalytic subunit/molybdopterin converting factor small subunit